MRWRAIISGTSSLSAVAARVIARTSEQLISPRENAPWISGSERMARAPRTFSRAAPVAMPHFQFS